MEKIKKIIFILLIIISILIFASCGQQKIATKYVSDIVFKKSGEVVRGVFLTDPNDNSIFITIVLEDGTIKNLNKKDIKNIGLTDVVILKNGTNIMGSIEIDEEIFTKSIDLDEDIKLSDISRVKFIENNKVSITLKSGTTVDCSIDLKNITIIESNYSLTEIKASKISSILFRGTPKPKPLNPIELFNQMRKNMGPQNIIQTNPDSDKVENGWLYTIMGISVVFAALSLMVLAFFLMGVFSKQEKAEKEKIIISNKTDELEISPDIVSAIALTIYLNEETENVILTINREKSKSKNWLLTGIVDNAQRQDFY